MPLRRTRDATGQDLRFPCFGLTWAGQRAFLNAVLMRWHLQVWHPSELWLQDASRVGSRISIWHNLEYI
jgi:hypothetical protein